MTDTHRQIHCGGHAFTGFNARLREGLTLSSRRSVLKASLAGIAGLSLGDLLRLRGQAAAAGTPIAAGKSVILLWMTGGPSHIDTWDVKPLACLPQQAGFVWCISLGGS